MRSSFFDMNNVRTLLNNDDLILFLRPIAWIFRWGGRLGTLLLNDFSRIKYRANLAGVEINEYLDDEEFEKVTKEAHETAKELFKLIK